MRAPLSIFNERLIQILCHVIYIATLTLSERVHPFLSDTTLKDFASKDDMNGLMECIT